MYYNLNKRSKVMAWDKITKKNLEKLYNYENYDKENFNKFLKENNKDMRFFIL